MTLGRQRHIALFVPDLHGGGAERMMALLARGLSSSQCRVDIVVVRAGDPDLPSFPEAVRICRLKSFHLLTSVLALARYLRRESPDVMLSALMQANVIALLARRLAGTATRVVIREANHESTKVEETQAISDRLAYRLVPLVYPWADGIIAVARSVAEDLSRSSGLPVERIRVIYNAAVTPELRQKAPEAIAHPWFVGGAPPVVLGVGRLKKQKDFATLIRAFAEVRQVRPARLMILGKGEERSGLEQLVSQLGLTRDVSIAGFVPNVYAFMARCSTVVSSSAWEGCSNVILEALAVGAPVVATDCPGGSSEILGGGRYGHLVSVGDSNAMAGAILDVLSGAGKRAPPEWLRQFDLEVVLEQYRRLLGGPS